MAALYHEDIITIDLANSGTLHRSFLNHSLGEADMLANWFGVCLERNGEPVSVEDCTVTGLFMAPNGTTYLISETSFPGSTGKSGNKAYVVLPEACYAMEGQFSLAIKLIGGGVTGTMRIVDGVVSRTGATAAVVPSASVPTSEEIIAAYEEALALINGVVLHDVNQSLQDADKQRARSNIDAASIYQVVRHDVTQSLQDADKERARKNIAAQVDIGFYIDAQGYVCQRISRDT